MTDVTTELAKLTASTTELTNTVVGKYAALDLKVAAAAASAAEARDAVDGPIDAINVTNANGGSVQDYLNSTGTAAKASVTTSSTDTTAGRLLKVGDFGLGDFGTFVSSLNGISVGGMYRIAHGDAVAGGAPYAAPWEVISIHYDSNSAKQIAFSAGVATLIHMERVKKGGSWQEWHEIYHSGNTGTAVKADVTSSATDETVGNILKVGDFSLGGNLIVAENPNNVNKTYATRLPSTVEGINYMPKVGFYTMDTATYDNNSGHQLAKDMFDRQMYHRTKQGGSWDTKWFKIYDSGNTNFNEFGGSGGSGGKVVATGVCPSPSLVRFVLPLAGKTVPTSITVTGTFSIKANNTIIATGLTGSDFTLRGYSGEKTGLVGYASTGLVQNSYAELITETASSKITVNY